MQYLKDEVRKNILESAAKEFQAKGYARANISNIAANADVSLGNIYRYYKNKEDLYSAVVSPLLGSLKEFFNKDAPVELDSTIQLSMIVDFLYLHADEFLVIRRSMSQHYNELIDYLVSIIEGRITFLYQSIDNLKTKIKNPNFLKTIATSFLHSLFYILNESTDEADRKNYIRELMLFSFGDLKNRLKLLGQETVV